MNGALGVVNRTGMHDGWVDRISETLAGGKEEFARATFVDRLGVIVLEDERIDPGEDMTSAFNLFGLHPV